MLAHTLGRLVIAVAEREHRVSMEQESTRETRQTNRLSYL